MAIRSTLAYVLIFVTAAFAIFRVEQSIRDEARYRKVQDAKNVAQLNRNKNLLALTRAESKRQDAQLRRATYTLCRSLGKAPKSCKHIARGVIIKSKFTVGTRGPRGKTGEPGKTGVITLRQTILKVIHEQGIAGARGPRGFPGRNGTNGRNGTDGTNGKNGSQGTQGPKGITGPQGPPGITTLDALCRASGFTARTMQLRLWPTTSIVAYLCVK